MTLVPCPSCQRHIKLDHAECPFCASALPQGLRATVPAAPAGRRLDRWATFTFATALTVAACGGIAGDDPGPDGKGGGDGDAGSFVAMYGMPIDAAARDGATSGEGGTIADAAAKKDGATKPDAGPKDDGGVIAMYGMPPPDSGNVFPPYGVPQFDDGGGAALYGLPPPPPPEG